jgi:ABC-type transport system involved in multi-copper enzyme maturation permease subunit
MTNAVAPSQAAAAHRAIDARHVGLIARFAGRFEIRKGGGILFLFVALFVGIETASGFLTIAENIIAGRDIHGKPLADADSGTATERLMTSPAMRESVSKATGADDRQADYLLRDNPGVVSAIALALLFIFPFLACLGAFNQTAGDIGSRGLRYLLLRTERANVFLGRLLGTYAFIVTFAVLLMLVVLLYVGLKLRVYDVGALVTWGAQCVLALCLVALPYVALCAWISGSVSSTWASLALCAVGSVGPPVVFLIVARSAPAGDLAWISKLVPFGWKWDLLSHDLGTRLLGYGAMLGFTAIFLALGLRTFRRRDL